MSQPPVASLNRPFWGHVLAAIAVLLLALVLAGSWFIRKYFGLVLPDQVIYHLQQGGMEYSDPKLVGRALRYLAGALVLTIVLVGLQFHLPRGWRRLPLLVLLGMCTWSVAVTLDVRCAGNESDYLAEHYVPPQTSGLIAPAQAPDVLIVFFESLESAVADASAFGQNLIPQLSAWRDQHRSYGTLLNLGGASWTMGGMFSTLCGTPLQAVGLLNQNSYEFGERFFSAGTCLPDLLAAHGYENSFYGGASLKFAGKGKFLAAHAIGRRFGAEEWKQQGLQLPDATWGMVDSELMKHIQRDMNRPRTNDRPRLDIVLTLNTHPPTGGDDPGCQRPDVRLVDDTAPGLQMRRAYRCSDHLVAQLLQSVAARADGHPKVILVQGDHLLMRSDMDPQIQAFANTSPRTVFHAIARFDGQGRRTTALPPTRQTPARQLTHVDLMPTLLHEAGFRWDHPKGQLAMGTSLAHLADAATGRGAAPVASHPTLVERHGFQTMDSRSRCQSSLFDSLW